MRWIKFFAAGAVLSLLTFGCEKEKIIEVGVESPVQVAVQASPSAVDTGQEVTVSATVTAPNPAGLTFSWTADGGSFADSGADTTTWTAPDTAGLYNISFVATDNVNVGQATVVVAVATYMPTDAPSYVGAAACAVCHAGGAGGDQHTTWATSPHAAGFETLVLSGTEGNTFCWPCHTVGYNGLNADPALKNGGFDETQIEGLHGIQPRNVGGMLEAFRSKPRDLYRQIGQGCFLHVGGHDPHTLIGGPLRHGEADPARGSRHDRDSALELLHHISSPPGSTLQRPTVCCHPVQ